MNYRNRPLLEAIASLPCQLQVIGVCAGPDAPCCACHSNQSRDGKGRGIKAHDSRAAAGCAPCHDWLDQGQSERWVKIFAFDKAALTTLWLLVESGILVVAGAPKPREREYERPTKVMARR